MTLKKIFGILHTHCGDDKDAADFVVFAIAQLLKDGVTNPLRKASASKVFSGERNISPATTRTILSNLNKDKFVSFISEFEDDTKQSLSDAVNIEGYSTTLYDVADHCAEIIIQNISGVNASGTAASGTIKIENGKLYFGNREIPMPETLTPPISIESHEIEYIRALLLAYSDAEGITGITRETLCNYHEKYKKSFDRERQHYFSAEAVNRRLRDVFPPDNDQFAALKTEILDGVIEVAEATDHANGFVRLTEVLKHATVVNINGSIVVSLPTWITNKVRKGICHFLVNDGSIRWVLE